RLANLHRFFAEITLVQRVDVLVRHDRAAVGGCEALLEMVDRLGELVAEFIAEFLGLADLREDAFLRRAQVIEELGFEPADVLDRDRVEMSLGTEEDRDDLLFDRQRLVLRLLEQLHESGPAPPPAPRGGPRSPAGPAGGRPVPRRRPRTTPARGTATDPAAASRPPPSWP